MERRLTRSYMTYGVIGSLLLGCFFYFVTCCIYQVSQYKIYIDPIVSQVSSDSIATYIKKMNGTEPEVLFKNLQKTFPFIKSMRARYLADGKLKVSLKSFVPRLKVNKEFALTENGELVALNSFVSSCTERLPSLTVCADDQVGPLLSDDVLAFAHELPADLIAQCNITLTEKNDVSLQDHATSNFVIRCCSKKLPSHALREQCKKIKNEFLDTGLLCDGDSDCWIADVRFGDQIVLYRQREGVWCG